MLTENALWDGPTSTLGDEFARIEPRASLGGIEREWLDAMNAREATDVHARRWVLSLRDGIKRVASGDVDAESVLNGLFDDARNALYPASALLLKELQSASGVGGDDTMKLIERASVRRLDDDAASDADRPAVTQASYRAQSPPTSDTTLDMHWIRTETAARRPTQ